MDINVIKEITPAIRPDKLPPIHHGTVEQSVAHAVIALLEKLSIPFDLRIGYTQARREDIEAIKREYGI